MNMRNWTYEAPFGPLAIASSDDGLVRVAFLQQAEIDQGKEPEIYDAFTSYFDGEPSAFDALPIDRQGWGKFRIEVLDVLSSIKPGSLMTYGEIARQVGRPRASRAVGQAVGSNPVPIAIPCHRVVAADGSLGGFSGGLDQKRWLLKHEGYDDLSGGWPSRRAPASVIA